jgi:NADH-quinone oxidoreductase subunit M
LPLLAGAQGVLILLFLDGKSVWFERAERIILSVVCLGAFLGALLTLAEVSALSVSGGSGVRLLEVIDWVPSLGLRYALGATSISALFAVSISFLFMLLFVWSNTTALNLCSLLLVEGAIFGVLFSQDLVLFYIFWELMLVPVFLLMIFGNGTRRFYAAYRFLLLTAVCAVWIISGLLYVSVLSVRQLGHYSFLLTDLTKLDISETAQILLCIGFIVAFLVKIPVFPLHTWLRDAQCESSWEGAVLFTAILFQVGIFGLITLIVPVFPLGWEVASPYLGALGVFSIFYGGVLAYRETNLRALVAYSSIAHLGLVTLGVAVYSVESLTGSVFHSIAHGISAAAVMFVIGTLGRRYGVINRDNGGNLAARTPLMSVVFFLILTGYLALPLTNGFIGELAIIVSVFSGYPFYTVLALLGILIGSVYVIQVFGSLFFGVPITDEHTVEESQEVDRIGFTRREWCALLPLLILTFGLGVFPTPFLRMLRNTTDSLVVNYEIRLSSEHGRLLQEQSMRSALEEDESDILSPISLNYSRYQK